MSLMYYADVDLYLRKVNLVTCDELLNEILILNLKFIYFLKIGNIYKMVFKGFELNYILIDLSHNNKIKIFLERKSL